MAEHAHSTRRGFLKSAAAITALSGAGCAQVAMAETETQEDKVRRLIRELQIEMCKLPTMETVGGSAYEIKFPGRSQREYLRLRKDGKGDDSLVVVGFIPPLEA